MATSYGPTVNHWRAYVDYATSTTSTQVNVSCSGIGMESVAYGFSIAGGITSYVSLTGSSWHPSATGGFSSAYGATTKKNFIPDGSREYAFNRTHSAYTAYVTNQVTNASGYMNGTSTASVAVSVPAKSSWTVSYDANGGAGAPSSQTKWYGETLTLSATRPTRDGHTFMGWATASDGTATYQPGTSYTANAAAKLYAVWRLDHATPTVSSVGAFRCTAGGVAANEGTSVKASATWACDGDAASVTFSWRERGGTDWTTKAVSASGTSGTTAAVLSGPFDAAKAYDVQATVTDAAGYSTSATTIVAPSFFTLDFAAGGKGVGVGCASPKSGLSVAMDAEFSGAVTAQQLNGHSLADMPVTSLYKSSLGGECFWYCVNGVVTVKVDCKLAAFTSWQSLTLATLPAGYRPQCNVPQPVAVQNVSSASNMRFMVATSGAVTVSSQGGAGATSQYMFATITYPVW